VSRADRFAVHSGIYLVTDGALCGPRGVVETVRAAVEGGVGAVQLRDKTSETAVQLRQVERLAEVIAGRAQLLVNDRLDVVLAARRRGIPVDGVHLGQGDAGASAAREALGADAVVGITANTRQHLAELAELDAGTVDYLGVGVIRPTSTKSDHPPALGVDGFARLATATQVPCVAIGGIVCRTCRGCAGPVRQVSQWSRRSAPPPTRPPPHAPSSGRGRSAFSRKHRSERKAPL